MATYHFETAHEVSGYVFAPGDTITIGAQPTRYETMDIVVCAALPPKHAGDDLILARGPSRDWIAMNQPPRGPRRGRR